ncbi:unnamed protein product [Linum tenue]|uniref:Uncharacterized protein n=1 Tax=Linum tenue TaxID=586396 RepID=A0AAV0J7B3_9ROSI|nr:unnamed protein product [Linum tenue]
MPYNGSVPFEDRVDTALSYFDLPSSEIPEFLTLYFEDPDHQGHLVGPDDLQVTEAVTHIDGLIGRLIGGLEKRGVFEDVTIIMVGDHGMVGNCDKKLIFLEDLAEWVKIPAEWVSDYTPALSMLHYSDSERIPPIIGMLDEGFKVEPKRTAAQECGGSHGYDNAFFSMRTIFIAHGPRFGRGVKVPSFENVQIYNVIASILNVPGAPNNGSWSFPRSILLPEA